MWTSVSLDQAIAHTKAKLIGQSITLHKTIVSLRDLNVIGNVSKRCIELFIMIMRKTAFVKLTMKRSIRNFRASFVNLFRIYPSQITKVLVLIY